MLNSLLIEIIINILTALASIFIVSNIFYIVLIYVSKKMLNKEVLNWPFLKFKTRPISLIVPAFNEEKNIINSINSFLNQNYENFEIIIVNDGSSDQTLKKVLSRFEFTEIEYRKDLFKLCKTKINKIYFNEKNNMILIDKKNGGKADSLNAGIDIAKYDYVCSVDADSILDPNAFNRVMIEFEKNPELLACGATIRVINGSIVKDGRIEKTGLPDSYIELCQLLEYNQSFLMGRLGWQFFNATMIISGAFGIFHKNSIKEINGFDKKSVGEDMDLIVRLHKYFSKKKGSKYSIGFVPDPLCWTEVPSNLKTLSNQRNRWQRGLLSSIFKGNNILFNTKKSFFSRFAIPYYLITEILSPIIEIISYILVLIGLIFNFINYKIVFLFFLISLMFSVILSLTSLLYEEKSFSKNITIKQLIYLFLGSIVMNIGYRQYIAYQRIRGVIDFYLQKQDWGKMDRKGF